VYWAPIDSAESIYRGKGPFKTGLFFNKPKIGRLKKVPLFCFNPYWCGVECGVLGVSAVLGVRDSICIGGERHRCTGSERHWCTGGEGHWCVGGERHRCVGGERHRLWRYDSLVVWHDACMRVTWHRLVMALI